MNKLICLPLLLGILALPLVLAASSTDSVEINIISQKQDKQCYSTSPKTFSSLEPQCKNIQNCSSWVCQNGVLTRTCQFNTCQDTITQYGDVCGIEQAEKGQETEKANFNITNIVLIFLILIAIDVCLLVYAVKK